MRAILQSIANAVSSDQISKFDALRMRAELGISKNYFTKKHPTRAQRKAKRVMQKNSRRINRNK